MARTPRQADNKSQQIKKKKKGRTQKKLWWLHVKGRRLIKSCLSGANKKETLKIQIPARIRRRRRSESLSTTTASYEKKINPYLLLFPGLVKACHWWKHWQNELLPPTHHIRVMLHESWGNIFWCELWRILLWGYSNHFCLIDSQPVIHLTPSRQDLNSRLNRDVSNTDSPGPLSARQHDQDVMEEKLWFFFLKLLQHRRKINWIHFWGGGWGCEQISFRNWPHIINLACGAAVRRRSWWQVEAAGSWTNS